MCFPDSDTVQILSLLLCVLNLSAFLAALLDPAVWSQPCGQRNPVKDTAQTLSLYLDLLPYTLQRLLASLREKARGLRETYKA